MRTGQSSWILKQESPSPSASSLRRTATSSRRSRSQPPTRRSTSSSLTAGLGGKVVVNTPPTLLLPTSPLAGSSATPKRRFASSGSATTLVTATPPSIVTSTSTRSSRSNSLGIANTHLFPLHSFPSSCFARPLPHSPAALGKLSRAYFGFSSKQGRGKDLPGFSFDAVTRGLARQSFPGILARSQSVSQYGTFGH